MKKILCMLMVLMCCASALAAEITVRGEGTVMIPADTAVISLGVQATSTDALDAQAQVNTAAAAVLQALADAGVPDEDISTDYINIYPQYDYSSFSTEAIAGYSASYTLCVRTTDMNNIGALIDLCFGAGANTLNGVVYSSTVADDYREEAFTAAVADGQDKAGILCKAMGAQTLTLEEVAEDTYYSYDVSADNFGAKEAAAAGTDVRPAMLKLTASLTMTYEVE